MSPVTLTTADQLLRMPHDGCRYELVAGELRKMAPAGWEHGDIGGQLEGLLWQHVRKHRLGKVFLAETGFLLASDPDTVRAPDIAFIRKERIPRDRPRAAFWPGAPDLAVEVVSPGDTFSEVVEKVQEWLDAGAMMVWVVDPKRHSVTVYGAPSDIRVLSENDELSGEEVVPGFRCAVREIFEGV